MSKYWRTEMLRRNMMRNDGNNNLTYTGTLPQDTRKGYPEGVPGYSAPGYPADRPAHHPPLPVPSYCLGPHPRKRRRYRSHLWTVAGWDKEKCAGRGTECHLA